MATRSVFEQVFREIRSIRARLDDIGKCIAGWKPQPIAVCESALLGLPDHLRRTYVIVLSKGECCAVDVAVVSQRGRSVESAYLNQLVRLGFVSKRREFRKVFFRAVSKMEGKS